MLTEVPGLEDRSAMSRLIAKLEAAAGEAASVSAQVAVQVDIADGDAEGYAGQIRAALSARRRVHLRYYVPGRDEATERDVDPMRLLVVEGRPYLEGWCLRAEGVRLFRLDRVLSLDVLDVPSAPPAEAEPVDVDQGLFRPSPDDVLVELELSAAGRWVAEYYPCESVTDLDDGRLRVVLRTPWSRRRRWWARCARPPPRPWLTMWSYRWRPAVRPAETATQPGRVYTRAEKNVSGVKEDRHGW